jgi:hypothetical protein
MKMKPNGLVPEIITSSREDWTTLHDLIGKPPILRLEGLVSGKEDAGFLMHGILFRLTSG